MRTSEHCLWYRQAADNWNEALPLGNGRIGAMAYGGAQKAVLALNEDTLWSGYPRKSEIECSDVFSHARELALAGNMREAQKLLEDEFGDFLVQMYLPLGQLTIEMDHEGDIANYRRELFLDKALHVVKYSCGSRRYERRCFISEPDQVLVMRVTCDESGSVGFVVRLSGALKCSEYVRNDALFLEGNAPVCLPPYGKASRTVEDHLYFDDKVKKGIGYLGGVRVSVNGGSLRVSDNMITVSDADSAEIYFAVRTSYNGAFAHPVLAGKEYHHVCLDDLDRAASHGYDDLQARHLADFEPLYARAWVTLGEAEASCLPTDERLIRHAAGESDPALYALLFHYGRYLALASSRYGTQPSNLQGIWNDKLLPPWSSNYTLNINTEMNYWPVLKANLDECFEPLVRMTEELHFAGRETARKYYDADGFCSHHATDLWRVTHPNTNRLSGCCQWGQWPLSSGWLCKMLFDYYRYTDDQGYLKRILPVLVDGADFYRSLLKEKNGEMIFSPSTSPENGYVLDGERCALDVTTTMTCAIIRDCLTCAATALEAVGLDPGDYRTVSEKIRDYSLNSDGSLNEWYSEHEDAEVHHRHVSHLYGLFPSEQINDSTPQLLTACRKTLEKRGDESTGWSLAWKINLWAHLSDGNRAKRLLDMQLRPVFAGRTDRDGGGGSYFNLMCAHPPFQIDGNFGACSGIMEMLVQTNRSGELVLLPALPDEWKNGELHGICLPGNRVLSMRWQDGKVQEVRMISKEEQRENSDLQL